MLENYVLEAHTHNQIHRAKKCDDSEYDFEREGVIEADELEKYNGLEVEELSRVSHEDSEYSFEYFDENNHLVRTVEEGEYLIVHSGALGPDY